MLLDQTRVEAVVTRGNRRMGRKHDFARNTGNGTVKIETFLLHAVSNRFKDRKSAVPFVQMENAGGDAHRLQCAESAHTQKQFLTDSKAGIASIKARCEFPIFRRVSFDVRIQQK